MRKPGSFRPCTGSIADPSNTDSRLSTGSCDQYSAAPIFVVGPSRSGTTLLREILNNHSRLWITAETHFFDDLRPRLPRGAALGDADAARCEDYLLGIRRRYGLGGPPEAIGIGHRELRLHASACGGTAESYFMSFCQIIAENHGKDRWGEKTPRHVFRIGEILEVYASAKVVCLVRDPRAVAASYRDWTRSTTGETVDDPAERRRKRWSYHPLLSSLLWRSAVQAAHAARQRHGESRIYLQRFERLVCDPTDELSSLCDWLEIEFEPQMLDVPFVASSYPIHGSARGIKPYPASRWRTELPAIDLAIVQRVSRRTMRDLDYSTEAVRVSHVRLALALASAPFAVARAIVVNRQRLGKPAEYLRARARHILIRHIASR